MKNNASRYLLICSTSRRMGLALIGRTSLISATGRILRARCCPSSTFRTKNRYLENNSCSTTSFSPPISNSGSRFWSPPT